MPIGPDPYPYYYAPYTFPNQTQGGWHIDMATKQELEAKIAHLEARLSELEGGEGTTYVGIVQDRSGSMSHLRDSTISGFNEYIKQLKDQAGNTAYRITLTQFDNTVQTKYENQPLAEIKEMTHADYTIGNTTALFDAVGSTIKLLDDRVGKKDKALVVIMTDGFENASSKYTREKIAKMITKREAKGNWTFIYLGAGIDAFTGGTSIGVVATNTYSYAANAHDTRRTYGSLAGASTLRSASSGRIDNLAATSFVNDDQKNTSLWTPDSDDE